MQIAVITGPTIDVALPRIQHANSVADGVEIRLDLFHRSTLDDVKKMREACTGKMIVTLRGKKAGGGSDLSDKERLSLLSDIITIGPDYIDLESNLSTSQLKSNLPTSQLNSNLSTSQLNSNLSTSQLNSNLSTSQLNSNLSTSLPGCNVISSYHNFDRTPRNLEEVIRKMNRDNPAYAYKVCTTANSISDSYKMLRLIQKLTSEGIKFIGLCMGEKGLITREEGIKSGNYLNYFVLSNQDQCAPGLQFA